MLTKAIKRDLWHLKNIQRLIMKDNRVLAEYSALGDSRQSRLAEYFALGDSRQSRLADYSALGDSRQSRPAEYSALGCKWVNFKLNTYPNYLLAHTHMLFIVILYNMHILLC